MNGKLEAVFGWAVHVAENANPRSLRNFPLQANGGEMLRLACCLATEQGIRVCCPVHDALLIEAPTSVIHEKIDRCQKAMEANRPQKKRGFNYELAWARFKDPIANLVGWNRRDDCNPLLKTTDAYDVVYSKLFNTLHD